MGKVGEIENACFLVFRALPATAVPQASKSGNMWAARDRRLGPRPKKGYARVLASTKATCGIRRQSLLHTRSERFGRLAATEGNRTVGEAVRVLRTTLKNDTVVSLFYRSPSEYGCSTTRSSLCEEPSGLPRRL